VQAILICGEPWCAHWGVNGTNTHPLVAATVGFSRGFDFWMPMRCVEMLWLWRHGAPPASAHAFPSHSHSNSNSKDGSGTGTGTGTGTGCERSHDHG
jgi:hypothetical protein